MPQKKPVKPTLGLVTCPICSNARAEVRQQDNRLLYYMCRCGRITPNKDIGQQILAGNVRRFNEVEREAWNDHPTDKEGLRVVPVWPMKATPEPVNRSPAPEPVNRPQEEEDPLTPPPPPEEKPEPVNTQEEADDEPGLLGSPGWVI